MYFIIFNFIVTYQCVSRFVLINSTDSGPVVLCQKSESWCVEGVFRWYYPKEIGKTVAREHRVGVRVTQL